MDLNTQKMSDTSNICLSCGYCCDGTLIGFVELNHEELPKLRQIMEIEDSHGNGFFLQPCSNFCDGCTIYSNRPKQCDNFKCELLKAVEQKDLAFDSAIEIINIVKQKKIAIESKLALLPFEFKSRSFYFKIIELKKLLLKNKTQSKLPQSHLELLTDLNQLDSLLSDKFGVSMK